MIRCPNCGVFLNDSAIPYCPRCGRPISLDPMIQYQENKEKQKKERRTARILLIIALILTALYLRYSFDYWLADDTPGLASLLVMPHILCALVGFLINIIGAIIPRRALALAAAILYTISGVAMLLYIVFIAIQAALCYVAFAVMRTKQ